jgi:glycosyltransferase involved in cell wall biosynthesis
MLVSIIVPVYNASTYLPRCLESLINQTYGELEIIVVNDGSTDDSQKICDDYAKKDKRIVSIVQKNKGVSSARNVGIDIATGKYLQFVDADDYVEPTYTELLLSQMQGANVDLAICNFYNITVINDREVKKEKHRVKTGTKYRDDFTLIPMNNADRSKPCTRYEIGFVWGRMLSRRIINDNRIRFDEKVCFQEDLLFNLSYNLHIRNANVIDDALYYYHSFIDSKRKSSKVTNAPIDNSVMQAYIKKRAYEVFYKNGVTEEAFKSLAECFASQSIAFFVRSCDRSYGYSFAKSYKLARSMIGDQDVRGFLASYEPNEGMSKAVPFFLRKKVGILAVFAAKLHLWRARV